MIPPTFLDGPACGVVNSQLAADDVGEVALVPIETADRRAFLGGVGPSSVKTTDPESSMASSSMSSISQLESASHSVLALSSEMAGMVLVLKLIEVNMDGRKVTHSTYYMQKPETHLATRLMAAPKLGASLAFVATLSSLMAVPGLVSSSELVSLTN